MTTNTTVTTPQDAKEAARLARNAKAREAYAAKKDREAEITGEYVSPASTNTLTPAQEEAFEVNPIAAAEKLLGIAREGKIVKVQDIKRTAPAVFATEPATDLSPKYSFINTDDVRNALMDEGWDVVEASQPKRLGKKAMHVLTFEHESYQDFGLDLDGIKPRIVIVNSHDGRRSLTVMVGIFRLVCTNGLMVGSTTFQVRLRHRNIAQSDIIEAVKNAAGTFETVGQDVKALQGITLTDAEELEFASQAMELRRGWNPVKVPVEALVEARREEDMGRDLWSIYNKVQENITHGGFALNSGKPAKALDSAKKNFLMNTRLWNLVQETATKVGTLQASPEPVKASKKASKKAAGVNAQVAMTAAV